MRGLETAAKKVKINCYVEPELYAWLSGQAEQRGVTFSTLAAGILAESRRRIEQPDQEPLAQLAKHLDRLQRAVRTLKDDHHFMEEMLAAFVRVYLNHAPAVPEHMVGELNRSGGERFEKFLRYLAQNVGKYSLVAEAKAGRSAPESTPEEVPDDQ